MVLILCSAGFFNASSPVITYTAISKVYNTVPPLHSGGKVWHNQSLRKSSQAEYSLRDQVHREYLRWTAVRVPCSLEGHWRVQPRWANYLVLRHCFPRLFNFLFSFCSVFLLCHAVDRHSLTVFSSLKVFAPIPPLSPTSAAQAANMQQQYVEDNQSV